MKTKNLFSKTAEGRQALNQVIDNSFRNPSSVDPSVLSFERLGFSTSQSQFITRAFYTVNTSQPDAVLTMFGRTIGNYKPILTNQETDNSSKLQTLFKVLGTLIFKNQLPKVSLELSKQNSVAIAGNFTPNTALDFRFIAVRSDLNGDQLISELISANAQKVDAIKNSSYVKATNPQASDIHIALVTSSALNHVTYTAIGQSENGYQIYAKNNSSHPSLVAGSFTTYELV